MWTTICTNPEHPYEYLVVCSPACLWSNNWPKFEEVKVPFLKNSKLLASIYIDEIHLHHPRMDPGTKTRNASCSTVAHHLKVDRVSHQQSRPIIYLGFRTFKFATSCFFFSLLPVTDEFWHSLRKYQFEVTSSGKSISDGNSPKIPCLLQALLTEWTKMTSKLIKFSQSFHIGMFAFSKKKGCQWAWIFFVS